MSCFEQRLIDIISSLSLFGIGADKQANVRKGIMIEVTPSKLYFISTSHSLSLAWQDRIVLSSFLCCSLIFLLVLSLSHPFSFFFFSFCVLFHHSLILEIFFFNQNDDSRNSQLIESHGD